MQNFEYRNDVAGDDSIWENVGTENLSKTLSVRDRDFRERGRLRFDSRPTVVV